MRILILVAGFISLLFASSAFANDNLIFGGNIVFPDGSVQNTSQITIDSICYAISPASPSFCSSYQPPVGNANPCLVFGGNFVFPDGSVQSSAPVTLGSICNVILTANLTLPSFCSSYQPPSFNADANLISIGGAIVFPDESTQSSAVQITIASLCNAINSATQSPPSFCTSAYSPTLVSVAVTPANPSMTAGSTRQFTATGTYSDNSTKNLTSSVIWNSSNTSVAAITSGGLASIVTAGTTIITASSGAIAGTATLTATPSPTQFTTAMASGITFGVTQSINNGTINFYGLGNYNSDGTIDYIDVTNGYNTGTWTINNSGQLILTWTTGTLSGFVETKTLTGSTNNTITVNESITIPGTPPLILTGIDTMIPLESITVTPTNPSLSSGATQQFTATGTFADGSTNDLTSLVTWSSSKTSYATILSGGLATGVAAGPTTIAAASGSITGSTLLSVTASTTNTASDLQSGAYNIKSTSYIPSGAVNSVPLYYYQEISSSGGILSIVINYYNASTETWSTTAPSGYAPSPIYMLTPSGWVQTANNMNNGDSVVSNSDGSVTITSQFDGSQANIVLSSTNISNVSIASAYPKSGKWPLLNNGLAAFPSGSVLYTNTMTYLNDSYTLWGSEVQNPIPLTVLSNIPSSFQQVNIDAKGSFYCTFDSTGSTATIWQYQSSDGTSSSIGSATWAITTVDGQQFIEISIPNTFRTQYQLGGNPIIAIVNGYAWVGEHAIPGFTEYGYSGGGSFNGTAFNFILTQFQ